jgi:hypothetical protein|tara:strand:+ start:1486 stop:1668 length:183 start_codon:yes stop_codon:yes gene_type:complete
MEDEFELPKDMGPLLRYVVLTEDYKLIGSYDTVSEATQAGGYMVRDIVDDVYVTVSGFSS